MELLGTFEDRSCVYIVMEECRGGDLETLLEVRLAPRCTPSSDVHCAALSACSHQRHQSSVCQRSV